MLFPAKVLRANTISAAVSLICRRLKLLFDAVGTADFISSSQSKKLINKIIDLSAPSSKKELKRHVYIDEKLKFECNELFENFDVTHKAIKDSLIISF